MNHTAFFAAVKAGTLAPCYLFEGTEEYIRQQALKALYAAVLPAGLEAMNLTELTNPSADELIAACETLPFLGEKRLVIVREYAALGGAKGEEKQPDEIIDYLEHLSPSTCLVFYVKGKADGRKKLYGVLKKKNAIVDFSPLEEGECIRWIRATLKKSGKTISSEDAGLLCFTVGRDAALLTQEMLKLEAFSGDRGVITASDIETIATRSTECTVFQMVDAQVEGNYDRAFSLLRDMLLNGEDRIGILSMLLRQYRILYHMRRLTEENTPSASLANLLGIPPFSVNRTRQQAQRYPADRLMAAYEYLLDYETRIKQGRVTTECCAENALLFLKQILEKKPQ